MNAIGGVRLVEARLERGSAEISCRPVARSVGSVKVTFCARYISKVALPLAACSPRAMP